MTPTEASSSEPVLRLVLALGDTEAARSTGRMPSVRLDARDGPPLLPDMIRTDVEQPRIDVADGTYATVVAEIVLSRVLDEQAWLHELRRILRPGGVLIATVPAGGALAWLDAHNLYRYLTDITGRGASPAATLPTGWNRHYHLDELRDLVADAGFEVASISRAGIGLAEVPSLAGMIVGDFALGRPRTEETLASLRQWLERRDQRLLVPLLGKALIVRAIRPHE